MNTNDKGLHDPVRTLEEAKAAYVNRDPEMQLPEGETCEECTHANKCTAMYGAKLENTWCDFHPVRFVKSSRSTIKAMQSTIDTQAARIKDLEELSARLEADLVGALRDLED